MVGDRILASLNKQAIDFIRRVEEAQWSGTAWLRTLPMQVYVRKNFHAIIGIGRVCAFDLANIGLRKDMRGKGIFTQFLDSIEEIQPWDGIYIENIREERFANFFARRGYVRVNEEILWDVCMYKPRKTWVEKTVELQQDGKMEQSLDVIFDTIDDMLLASKFLECDSMLLSLEIDRFTDSQLITILTATVAAKDNLPNRCKFFDSVASHIVEQGRDINKLSGLR